MAFRTKLDYSDNRQIKQFEKTQTILSGGTSFGLTFSAMTSGPDPITSGETNTLFSIASTFSGNNSTTNYNWYESNMFLGELYLSALTPSNSATTQNVGPIFTANTSTIIDGNTVNLSYSGVSFDLTPIAFYDLGGGDYSGTVQTNELIFYSADTLDFTGRTIWADVSGITRTENLIVTNNPNIGYVMVCSDIEGRAQWSPVSGVTGVWILGSGTDSAMLPNSGSDASGKLSVAKGSGTTASGDYSSAGGKFTIASGIGSTTKGSGTTASGDYSSAEGILTFAIGDYSHAEGGQNSSEGNYSHAEGGNNFSKGNYSHAEGHITTASGFSSHAEGFLTYANGDYSHAEGADTQANGLVSHVEGSGTTAVGDYSHSGGYDSLSNGMFSFVHGSGSTANNINTIVLGGGITGGTENTTYVNKLNIKTLDVYADNAAATSGGLEVGTVYRTSTGQLMIRY